MATVDDLKLGLTLDAPATKAVGSKVKVSQVHLSLIPHPTLHIGYIVGEALPDGTVESREDGVLVVPVEDILDKYPVASAPLEAALKTLTTAAYTLLRLSGKIGTGVRDT